MRYSFERTVRTTSSERWIAAGMDIFTVFRVLGHESVTTTEQVYAGISDNRLLQAFDVVNAIETFSIASEVAEMDNPDTKDGSF